MQPDFRGEMDRVDELGALVDLTAEQRDAFGRKPQVVAHRVHELPIFGDDSLVALSDSYPSRRSGLVPIVNASSHCRRAVLKIDQVAPGGVSKLDA
jgi:hypothetical protein